MWPATVAGFVKHALKDICKGDDIHELDDKTETFFNDKKLKKMNLWGKVSLDIFSGHSPTVAAYRKKKQKLEMERQQTILSRAKSIQASSNDANLRKTPSTKASGRHLSVHRSRGHEPASPALGRMASA